jgi:hypothetical protein
MFNLYVSNLAPAKIKVSQICSVKSALLAKSAITIGLIARDLTSSAKWLAYLAFIVTGYLAFIDSPIPHLSTPAIPHFLTGLRRTRQVPHEWGK